VIVPPVAIIKGAEPLPNPKDFAEAAPRVEFKGITRAP
jgi:hypothetical protein